MARLRAREDWDRLVSGSYALPGVDSGTRTVQTFGLGSG